MTLYICYNVLRSALLEKYIDDCSWAILHFNLYLGSNRAILNFVGNKD